METGLNSRRSLAFQQTLFFYNFVGKTVLHRLVFCQSVAAGTNMPACRPWIAHSTLLTDGRSVKRYCVISPTNTIPPFAPIICRPCGLLFGLTLFSTRSFINLFLLYQKRETTNSQTVDDHETDAVYFQLSVKPGFHSNAIAYVA